MNRALTIVMAFVAFHGFAQSNADAAATDLIEKLEEASRIEDPGVRLQTYDSIVHDYELSSQPGVDVTSSKWVDSSSKDPLDDSRTVLLMLDAESGQDSEAPLVSLILRYKDRRTDIYINWNTDLGPRAELTWRVGDERSETAEWVESEDGRTTFYPGNAAELIRKLKGADAFIARVKPPNHEAMLVRFDTRGLQAAIAQHADDVNW